MIKQLADGTEELMGKTIIIDGVDVSGCRFYLYRTKQPENSRSCGEGLVDCNGKDCLYKQLQRLKAENAEIKAKLSTAETAYQICLASKENRHKKEIEKLQAELAEEYENSDKKENELRAQLGKNNHLYKENLRKIKNDLLHINTEIAHISQDKLTPYIVEAALIGVNSGLADLIRSIKDV